MSIVAERFVAYLVDGPQAAADAVAALDAFPLDRLVGLGVFAKGYEGNPELFYVFANLKSPTVDEERVLRATMGGFGRRTEKSFHDLADTDPRPHFIASGPVEVILEAIAAHFPGRVKSRAPDA